MRWLVAVVMLAACGSAPAADSTKASAGRWVTMPVGPLSARHSALAVAAGQQLLLLGGRNTPLCPPTASCVEPSRTTLADAAAYDVGSRTWRALARVPVAVSSDEAQAVVLGAAVHVLVTRGRSAGTHLRYDLRRDAWARLPDPPDHDVHLVAAGEVLVAYQGSQEGARVRDDLVYDSLTRRWAALPRDPLVPSFDRAMTWTGDRLVLTGPKVTASPGGADGPTYVRSAVLDLGTRTWTRLPEQTDLVSYGTDRSWDGEHVISPYLQRVDGGNVNGYGRAIATGGVLDVRTGRWGPLPAAPAAADGRYVALSRRWLTAGEGLVLDAQRSRWLPLTDPDPAVDQGEAAAWVDDHLVVWGGGHAEGALVATGSIWSPP